jgi:hypothetical protein
VLVLDCETDGTPAQALLYGYYQAGWWRKERETGLRRVEIWEEGWFYADDLPTRDPQAFARIQAHVDQVWQGLSPQRRLDLHLYSRKEFVDQVFFRVGFYGKALITGFNLPFDLSAIAEGWGPARVYRDQARGGAAFSLELRRGRAGTPNPHRPRVIVEHVNRTRAKMKFGGIMPKPKEVQ